MARMSIVETESFPDHRQFIVSFFGTLINVTVTATPSVVRRWIQAILYHYSYYYHTGRLVVGLGVQWTPFTVYDPPADTLQLCVGRRCLVFQLCHADDVPLNLRRFLSDSNITFVGFWNGSDARKLSESRHELVVHNLHDLREYVQTDEGESLARASVETIVEECLGFSGVRLEREISMSAWNSYQLSREQVLQACIDAYAAFEIGKDYRVWVGPDDSY